MGAYIFYNIEITLHSFISFGLDPGCSFCLSLLSTFPHGQLPLSQSLLQCCLHNEAYFGLSHLKTIVYSHSGHMMSIALSDFFFFLAVAFISQGLPPWLSRKESTCQCRRPGFNPCVGKIPWRRKWQPTPVLLPGKSHRLRSEEHV